MSEINTPVEGEEDAYTRYKREQAESEASGSPASGGGSDTNVYKSPTKEQNEAKGELNPISTDEMASESVKNAVMSPVDKALSFANRAIQGGQHVDAKKWVNMPEGPERVAAREEFFQKYYGKSYEDFENDNLLQTTWSSFQNQGVGASSVGAAVGMGALDFPIDVIGNLPGGEHIDNAWDQATEFNDPILQSTRKLSSIVIPTLMGSKYLGANVTPAISASNMPVLAKSLANIGAYGALDVGIIGLSDIGEEDNAARALVDYFPEVFGPDGSIPLPKWLVTLDGDSPAVRKMKNMYEAGFVSLPTNILGYWLQAGKPTLRWYNPLDDTARQYKNAEISLNAKDDTLREIAALDEALESGVNTEQRSALLAKRRLLVEDIENAGSMEDYIARAEDTRAGQVDDAAARKLNNSPDEVDWDADVYGEGNPKQSIPPANVARNMADTTAIKNGDVAGSPAPLITDGMKAETARETVLGIAQASENAGKFNAVIDGFKYSNKDMNEAAWKIYRSIIHADNIDDVKNLFLNNKRLLDLGEGAFRQEYASADQYEAALRGLRDLTDRYLGRGIMQASARVMDTLGREISDIAEATTKLAPHVDDDTALDLILEKMEYLMSEIGLNRHISKFQHGQLDQWTQALKTSDNPQQLINQLVDNFDEAEAGIHLKSGLFTNTLREIQKKNPLALKPFITEFERSAGDVDTLAKLMKFAEDSVTPLGMLVSPNPRQMNLWAKGAWSVGFNNVLSGLAAGKAVLANTTMVIAKPTVAILQGTIDGALKGGDFSALKKSLYYYGGVAETNKRALKAGWNALKKGWQDPDAMIGTLRKDMVIAETKDWDSLEEIRNIWVGEKNIGKVLQFDQARTMYDFSRWKYNRVGMTFLNAADAMLDTTMATYTSRLDAYAEVFAKHGKVTPDLLAAAEKKHYLKKFDKSGRLIDKTTEALAGETKLNIDDKLSGEINKAVTRFPFMKPLFMFPRTLSNDFKMALSWTPIQAIPGINKYSKVIWANTEDEIVKALAEHGIDYANTPNALQLFENLKTEYKGRMAFSGLLTMGLFQYAMNGNIRGNGSHKPGQNKYERDNLGFDRKTIKLPVPGGGEENDLWVSFENIPMVEPILTLLGDMAYYARDMNAPMMEDMKNKLTWTISATFFSDSVFQGLEPLVAILNGDTTWFNRLAANTTRMFIPNSGMAGILSKAIDSTQKNIHDDMMHYIMNRLPVASTGLPKHVDLWTGGYLNDIENPIARIANALSVVKVSSTNEWWREELRDMGYDGLTQLKTDSTGNYTYSPSEQEYVNKLVGEQEPFKEVIKLLKKPKYKDQIGKLKALRASGEELEWDKIDLKGKPPLFQEIDAIIKRAQANAEQIMLRDRPDIVDTITHQKLVKKYMQQGRVDDAREIGNRNQNEVQTLLQLRK